MSGFGREEFVNADLGTVGVAGDIDEQVAKEDVAQPGRGRLLLPGCERAAEGDLELVEGVVAGLVDAGGLGRRTHEEPGEHERERGMVLYIRDQACEEIR